MGTAADALSVLDSYGTDSAGNPIVTYPNAVPRITVAPVKVTAPSVTGPEDIQAKSDILDRAIAGKLETPPEEGANVSRGGAIVSGAINAASFGAAPYLAGLSQAGTAGMAPEQAAAVTNVGVPEEAPGLEGIGLGLARVFGNHPDPEARQSFEEGRQAALKDQELAQKKYPFAYLSGQLFGGLLTPTFGAGMAGSVGARAIAGAVGGGIGGTLYGAGSALSEGAAAPEVAANAVRGGVVGGVFGAPLNAALGPRVAAAVQGPGARAAETAANLGKPLPRGVASDNPAIRGTTAAITSVPIIGARIKTAVENTREAAGEAIGQSGVDQAIAANRKAINDNYNGVRSRIDPDRVMPMPETAKAVAAVKARRAAARQANPSQGLEQFENIATKGVSFNGGHRARVDAREAGDALNPHPGYNAADYNEITRAMTRDIRRNVARQGGQAALQAFEKAEKSFGPISEANRFLKRIQTQRGPGAGLDELGFNPSTGEFSLDKFVTAWNKIKPEARPFVPQAAHRQNIEDIFEMGQHIKASMRERNTSHTSNVLILWDLARDAIMTGAAVGAGVVSGASVLASAGAAAPAVMFMHWLASPAKAASMAAWSRAYRQVQSGTVTAARAAQFNIATRNLANTLGMPVERVIERLRGTLGSQAQEDQEPNESQ